MSKDHSRFSEKACCVVNAIVADAQLMLEQLSLPIGPKDTIKARRERAIRRSGLSHSKGFRLWYGDVKRLYADEFYQLVARYKAHVRTLENTLTVESQQLRALREAREMMDRQYELDMQASARAMGIVGNATGPNVDPLAGVETPKDAA